MLSNSRDLRLRRLRNKEGVERLETPMYRRPAGDVNDVYVRLHKGQSLMTLANTYYGDPTLWWFIAVANDLLLPFNVDETTVIRIPPKSKLA
jgi:nucleoid-associated protein YgaU